jgi:hypothetical protein
VVIIDFYVVTSVYQLMTEKLMSICCSGVPHVSTPGPLLFTLLSNPRSIPTSVVCCSTPIKAPGLFLVSLSIHLLSPYVICPRGVDLFGDFLILHFHIPSANSELQNWRPFILVVFLKSPQGALFYSHFCPVASILNSDQHGVLLYSTQTSLPTFDLSFHLFTLSVRYLFLWCRPAW